MSRTIGTLTAATLAAAVAGCGGPSAEQVLEQTATHLQQIKSAELNLRVTLEPRTDPSRGRVGFLLAGPLSLRPDGLPVARVSYTQIAGRRQVQATFLSTGTEAFVEAQGTAYRLPKQQTSALSMRAKAARRGIELPLGRWLTDPAVDDGPVLDGTPTRRLSAELDVAAALRDIFNGLASAGADVPDLRGTRADQLRDAVTSSSVDLWSGRDDHYLRKLRLHIEFEVEPPPALRERLGALVGGRFDFRLDLARVNRPVRVDAPPQPLPASRLQP